MTVWSEIHYPLPEYLRNSILKENLKLVQDFLNWPGCS